MRRQSNLGNLSVYPDRARFVPNERFILSQKPQSRQKTNESTTIQIGIRPIRRIARIIRRLAVKCNVEDVAKIEGVGVFRFVPQLGEFTGNRPMMTPGINVGDKETMKARHSFTLKAWLYSAAMVLILTPTITILAQTIKDQALSTSQQDAKTWAPWENGEPQTLSESQANPTATLKSAVQRELDALYARNGRQAPQMTVQEAVKVMPTPSSAQLSGQTIRNTSGVSSSPKKPLSLTQKLSNLIPLKKSPSRSSSSKLIPVPQKQSTVTPAATIIPQSASMEAGEENSGSQITVASASAWAPEPSQDNGCGDSCTVGCGGTPCVPPCGACTGQSKTSSLKNALKRLSSPRLPRVANRSSACERARVASVRPREEKPAPFAGLKPPALPTFAPIKELPHLVEKSIDKVEDGFEKGIVKVKETPHLFGARPHRHTTPSPYPHIRKNIQPTVSQAPVPVKQMDSAVAVADAEEADVSDEKELIPPAPAPVAKKKLVELIANVEEQADDSALSVDQEKIDLITQRAEQRGLKGFCPVALHDERTLLDANPTFMSVLDSKTYTFASMEAKAKFDQSPERYAPVANGQDVVLMARTSESEEGSLDHAVWFRGRLYLFSSQVTLNTFVESPEEFAAE